jgi:hypothetical protein
MGEGGAVERDDGSDLPADLEGETIRELFEELIESRSEVARLRDEVGRLNQALREVHSSTSWRITAPVRQTKQRLVALERQVRVAAPWTTPIFGLARRVGRRLLRAARDRGPSSPATRALGDLPGGLRALRPKRQGGAGSHGAANGAAPGRGARARG